MGRGKSGTSPGWDHPPCPRPSFTGPENLLLDKSAFHEPVKLGLIDRCRVHSTVTTGRRYSVDDNQPWRRPRFRNLGPGLLRFGALPCYFCFFFVPARWRGAGHDSTSRGTHLSLLLWFAVNIKMVIPITTNRDDGHLPVPSLRGR